MGYYSKSILTAAVFFTCLTMLITIPQSAVSQDWRLSATYNMQSVGFNYVPNRTYSGEINKAVKGMLEVELERYLLYRLYVAGKGELLVQNQEDFLIGGPVNFNQINFGATAGLQWPKLGVYGGVKAGGVWNFNIKATDPNGNQFWVKPTENADRFTTSITGGVKYYLLNFVRLQAEITKTHNLPQNIVPESSFTESPAFRSFDFSPVTFSVGVSISIPWNERERPEGDKTKLPPLMRVTAVNFDKPMDDTFVTSKFGPRWRSTHEGVDLDANLRDNIYAAEQGVVVKAGNGRGYGKMVRIKHPGGFETVYAHMSKIKVKEGDRVKKGQVVGKAGNTGTSSGVHLHFEIIKDGKPVNPQSYIRF